MDDKLPEVIGIRTKEFAPLLIQWKTRYKGKGWSEVLRRGLKKELAPFAGKRFAHLVELA